jgi:hypothetical protein
VKRQSNVLGASGSSYLGPRRIVNCMHERVSVVLLRFRSLSVVSTCEISSLCFFFGGEINESIEEVEGKGVRCSVIVEGVNHLFFDPVEPLSGCLPIMTSFTNLLAVGKLKNHIYY